MSSPPPPPVAASPAWAEPQVNSATVAVPTPQSWGPSPTPPGVIPLAARISSVPRGLQALAAIMLRRRYVQPLLVLAVVGVLLMLLRWPGEVKRDKNAPRRQTRNTKRAESKTLPASAATKAYDKGTKRVPRRTMAASLLDAGVARLRMCHPRSSAFAFGMFHIGPHLRHMMVFEAEVIHDAPVGDYPPRNLMGRQSGVASSALVQLLVYTERSIIRNEGWAIAYSEIIGLLGLTLLCEFSHVAGKDAQEQAKKPAPAYVSRAVEARNEGYFEYIHCPLPNNIHDSIMHAPVFELKLTAADSSKAIVHMQPITLCREGQPLPPTMRPGRFPRFGPPVEGRVAYGGFRGQYAEIPVQADHHTFVGEPGEQPAGLQQIVDRAWMGTKERRTIGNTVSSRGWVVGSHVREDVEPREGGEEKQEGGDVGICLRPYYNHGFYAHSAKRSSAHSWERLREFVDYHVLIGVDKVYFYDRYGEEFMGFVRPYILSGTMVHVPFPLFSEAFYRKELYYEEKPFWRFPDHYDQIIVMNHCLMQGRRNNNAWLAFIDTDEFLQFTSASRGTRLPSILHKMDETAAMAEAGSVRYVSFSVHRFQFSTKKSTSLVLSSVTERCPHMMLHNTHLDTASLKDHYHDKVIASPWRLLGGVVEVHSVSQLPSHLTAWLHAINLKVHHYSVSAYNCKKEDGDHGEDPRRVNDTSLLWAAQRLRECWDAIDGRTQCPHTCARVCNAQSWSRMRM